MIVHFSLAPKKCCSSKTYECFMAAFCFAQTREHGFHAKSVPLGLLPAHCYHITNEGTVFHQPILFLLQALPLCHYRPAEPANGRFYWMKQLNYLCGFGSSVPRRGETHWWSTEDLDSEPRAACQQF